MDFVRSMQNPLSASSFTSLPIIGTPFKRIDFDSVGPYPRTARGYKYILIGIFLSLSSYHYFSRYLEAILLHKVDEISMARAVIDIFSCTGLLDKIAWDQGSVFMGKLMKPIRSTLGIKPIRISPYHLETDGFLERWHQDLLSMLKKAAMDNKYWDLYLPFILFVYRQKETSLCHGIFSISAYLSMDLRYKVPLRF